MNTPSASDPGDATRQFIASLPDELAEALAAAAVPHWFDAEILAAILAVSAERAQKLLTVLPLMPLVQPWGEGQFALHELARQALLADLWANRPALYRAWSARAADYFATQAAPANNQGTELANAAERAGATAGERPSFSAAAAPDPRLRIESIYHRLLADPERGADEVWEWGAEWNDAFRYPLIFALVQAGLEHDQAGRLAGRARGWVHFLHGLYQIVYSEYRGARRALEAALLAAGSDRSLLANCIQSLGDVHVRLAEYPQARARYAEALPIYRDIGARLGEANCIQRLGDVAVAEDDAAQAFAHYQAALAQFQALGLPNDQANVVTRMAGVYERRKEIERSLEYYTQAVELVPDNPMWRRNRANAYIKAGDADRARADLAAAGQLQPDHPFLALRYGDLALLETRYAEAAEHYRTFSAALPNVNGGYFGLAQALLGLGDTAAALASLEKALSLTYVRQDVMESIEALERLLQRDSRIAGVPLALQHLHAWLAAHQASDQPPPAAA